jgi:streptogrisin D
MGGPTGTEEDWLRAGVGGLGRGRTGTRGERQDRTRDPDGMGARTAGTGRGRDGGDRAGAGRDGGDGTGTGQGPDGAGGRDGAGTGGQNGWLLM